LEITKKTKNNKNGRKMSTCYNCLKDAELQKSHIIPEFFYKYVYSEDHKFILVSEDTCDSRKTEQKGYREKLLCHDCEELLAKQEKITASFFKDLITNNYTNLKVTNLSEGITLVENYDYSVIKKCLLSILWRASITRVKMFSEYSLGPYEKKIKEIVFSKDEIPWNVFPIHISKVKISEKNNSDLILCHERGKYGHKTMYSITLAGYSFDYFIVESINEEYKPYFMNEDFCSIMEIPFESIAKKTLIDRFTDDDVKSFFAKYQK
jgi:hypothetical protein